MKFHRFTGKILTVVLLFTLLIFCIFNFKRLFPALNHNSLSFSNIKEDSPNDIPQNLNFLNDDKKAFIDYCQNIFGKNLPLTVKIFNYYGSVNGNRLYRIHANLISCEPAHQLEKIGSFQFTSDYLYRPSRTGLYIINEKGVYTLRDAYQENIINIADIYKLYQSKTDLNQAANSEDSKEQ